MNKINYIDDEDIVINSDENSILFLVTSVIHISKNVRVYGNNSRSIFTDDERFAQTIHTLESIREKVPDGIIILLESSQLLDEEIQKLEIN